MTPKEKEIKRLQKELDRLDDWAKANPTENPVANTKRAEYKTIIETAIKMLE